MNFVGQYINQRPGVCARVHMYVLVKGVKLRIPPVQSKTHNIFFITQWPQQRQSESEQERERTREKAAHYHN